MLIRDKVGEKLIDAISKMKDSDVEIVKLTDNEEFLNALLSKIKSELESLEISKSIDTLAEILELVDWIQVCFGSSKIDDVMEHRKEKLGLYWERYYIKEVEKDK